MDLEQFEKNRERLWALCGDRKEDRTAFIAALIMERCRWQDHGHFNPHQAQRVAAVLVSLAGSIKRHAEAACSYELSHGQERNDERNQAKFHEIAKLIGFEARTGGDPRGACAYLIDPANPREGDGWGNGWAVYA